MPAKEIPGAVELLHEDHEKVENLFQQFEKAKDESEKEEIANEVDLELRVHSMIEEEILYPAMQPLDSEIVAESFEEHGVVEQLLNELATMDLEDEQFEAKFKVMQENVEHHIEEEEGQMFPRCPDLPGYEEIGLKMVQRKVDLIRELKAKGSRADRATMDRQPATMLASGKSEALAENGGTAMKQPEAKTPSRSRSKSTAGTGSRRSTTTAGRSRK
jgi:hypothetical protein